MKISQRLSLSLSLFGVVALGLSLVHVHRQAPSMAPPVRRWGFKPKPAISHSYALHSLSSNRAALGLEACICDCQACEVCKKERWEESQPVLDDAG